MFNFSSKPFILCKLTNSCNQKCLHCYTDACSGGITQLRFEQVVNLLDDIKEINKKFDNIIRKHKDEIAQLNKDLVSLNNSKKLSNYLR